MTATGNGSSVIANRDINPSVDFAHAYPELAPLILNANISAAFARHDEAAKRWKFLYERLGKTALACVLLAMMAFDYQVTLQQFYGRWAALDVISVGLGAIGLISQLILIFASVKEKWLTQRFFAERLRCLKFQAFMVLAESSDAEKLKTNVEGWTRESLARLNQEVMGGRSALMEFTPSEISISVNHSRIAVPTDLLGKAAKVYDSLRLSVQAQHFGDQYRASENKARIPSLLSEATFGIGAVLAFIQIGTTNWFGIAGKATFSGPQLWQGWFAFLTLFLFVISAVVAVYERGSGNQPDAERYLSYVREVRRIRMLHGRGGAESFFESVKEMEEVALRELHDFCRDVKHSNYIF